jgi:hypothetical protein
MFAVAMVDDLVLANLASRLIHARLSDALNRMARRSRACAGAMR